jgi:hypothetical protein
MKDHMITSKLGTLTMSVEEIPVPANHYMVKMTRDFDTHETTHEYYFERKELIEFWQPLTQFIMEIENGISNSVEE